ncbi:HNH endonuclease signature motif containing protein [Pseudonocardia cypriaca]|uniref:HNH endonuclease signature motif containing protein n=1 Tax=Pseudonocardia cypriaca TaxID=882449 RepID=UPI001B861C3C|nr:HNH endonuclease signature motif containing protein [Pseudonocardia cypriaca]
MSDAERIDQIRALERLKSAAAAAQARLAVDLDTSVRAAHAAAGIPAGRQGRGVAVQVALARQESSYRGGRHLGLAKMLVTEMPHTLAALESGELSEWRAGLLARETDCLSREHRGFIDTTLCADPTVLHGWGYRRLITEIQKLACRLDPASVARRRGKAESERRVTCRPAPDTMACMSALLPVAQGAAVHAALRKAADTAIATGDGRTRGQLMADILVQRVTGQATATAVPIEVNLIMGSSTLFGQDDQPAVLTGHGPIPADLARRLAVSAAENESAWVRRLYATPDTGRLIGMESTRRVFPAGLARFIEVRDQFCRTPWCDAPIRHIDHALPHHEGGATSADNGNGLCAQCNHARQAPGWHARPQDGARHTVEITTPTGHRYRSTAPAPPGHPQTKRRRLGRAAATQARLSRHPRPV